MNPPPTFQSTSRVIGGLLALGVLCLGAATAGGFGAPRRLLASYLVAFAYWAGLAVGALLMLVVFYAVGARWMVVLRRVVEAAASTLPLFAVLFIPVALGLRTLYPWAGPARELGRGVPELLAEKGRWLAPGPFVLRAAAYFVVWIGAAEILFACSLRQDEQGGEELSRMARRVGAGSIPLIGLAMTFAAFDWLMSLDPSWGSTMFGVYWFAGSFLGAHAVVALGVYAGERAGLLTGLVRPAHYHSLGKLTFAFVCFWAYIAFSQFMLVWIANRPDEISWYAPRIRGAYLWVALALFFGKFVLPFVLLLPKAAKQNPAFLSAVCALILVLQYVDVHWVAMPALYPHGVPFDWADAACALGMGAVSVAFGLWRVRGARAVPVLDPYLHESLEYRRP